MLRSEAGFSLISVLTDFGLVAVAAMALGGLLVYNRTNEMRLKRRSQGDQGLVNAAAALQALNFDDLRNYCDAKGVLNRTRTPICKNSTGQLANTAEVLPGPDPLLKNRPKFIDVRKDWNGDPNAKGLACVELINCTDKIGTMMLTVTIQGIWMDPGGQDTQVTATPQSLTLRKSR